MDDLHVQPMFHAATAASIAARRLTEKAWATRLRAVVHLFRSHPPLSLWSEVKQRRITQIVLTYLAGGWMALELVDQHHLDLLSTE